MAWIVLSCTLEDDCLESGHKLLGQCEEKENRFYSSSSALSMVLFTEYFIIFIFQEGAGLETLCSAVRELIHSCGDELGWCFTEDQVFIDDLG